MNRIILTQTKRGGWLATHNSIKTHGYGDTPEKAVRDFRKMVAAYRMSLSEREQDLGEEMGRQLALLRTVQI